MPLSSAQSLFQLFSAYCPRPALKCCSFIFVFICQISKTQVPLRATPQNIKLESRPNPSRSIDKGWQAYLMECSLCPRLRCLLFHLAVFNRPWGHEKNTHERVCDCMGRGPGHHQLAASCGSYHYIRTNDGMDWNISDVIIKLLKMLNGQVIEWFIGCEQMFTVFRSHFGPTL